MSEEAVWKREGHLLEEAAGSISTLRKEIVTSYPFSVRKLRLM
jgi:hypothetical protein